MNKTELINISTIKDIVVKTEGNNYFMLTPTGSMFNLNGDGSKTINSFNNNLKHNLYDSLNIIAIYEISEPCAFSKINQHLKLICEINTKGRYIRFHDDDNLYLIINTIDKIGTKHYEYKLLENKHTANANNEGITFDIIEIERK